VENGLRWEMLYGDVRYEEVDISVFDCNAVLPAR